MADNEIVFNALRSIRFQKVFRQEEEQSDDEDCNSTDSSEFEEIILSG